ncbi:hypothetical protein [Chryseobacterium sp. SL1]|uniref:hypothetical protein n=1 Tax=Chryseobacterium sp. SL1 TaxID=2995159 RepID=UPI002276C77A|nr:hypothetical protein [Chryseobacterium sp. SL1]MCY1662586.1 hypothetical protein [Chryseobacterium sp. SL1]
MNDLSNFKMLKPNNQINNLVEFIDSHLDKFPDSTEFFELLEKKKNENQHSLSFCLYMTKKCNCDFYFARENSQRGSTVIDIGVYKGSNLIFTIEAKVLPTPAGTTATPRNVYEYVYGRGGGIQRFKDGKHGVDNHDNLLPDNGMIAYVKDKAFPYWHNQINQWIVEAGWDKNEKLKLRDLTSDNKYISIHKLNDSTTVKLYHFWINVNNKEKLI